MKKALKVWLDRLEATGKGKWLVQFVKFGLVGVSNTLLSLAVTYLIMALFHFLLGINETWSLNVATTVGYVAGVCNSYFWNRRYVFKTGKERNSGRAFAKMSVCYGGTYLLSMVLMDVLVEYCHVPTFLAPIPRLLITIPLNFVANKLWTFKDK